MFIAKILFVCAAVVLVSANPQIIAGGKVELTGNEIEAARERLNNSLSKLAAGDGPHYHALKILKSSTQLVAGSLDSYTVELADDEDNIKVCDVKIWTRSWLPNGVEVTFDCPNEVSVVKTHSS